MGNTVVTDAGNMFMNLATPTADTAKKSSDGNAFSTLMSKSTQDIQGSTSIDDKNEGVAKTQTIVETPTRTRENVNDSNERAKVEKVSDIDKVSEMTEKAAEDIKEDIKKTFDVSDEDIEKAMEVLGVETIDLLDPTVLKDVLMTANNVEDSMALLTDGDLYDGFKAVMNFAEQKADELGGALGTNVGELGAILDEVKDFKAQLMLDNNSLVQDNAAIASEVSKLEIDDETSDMQNLSAGEAAQDTVVGSSEVSVNVEVTVSDKPVTGTKELTNDKPVDADVKLQGGSSQGEIRTSTDSATETLTKTESSEKAEGGSEESGSNATADNGAALQNTVTQTVVTTQTNTVGDIVETVQSFTQSLSNANSIVSQVTESVRVNITPDTTTMEMQLHPATLGTVVLNISSQNGTVTANMLVQNDAVKAALESQLASLLETFNEQGQKVEAVSVEVASYNLDQGFAGEFTQQQSEGSNGKPQGRSRRQINLNDLAEIGLDEISEEEQLAADMMRRSGNSVDFTA